MDLDFTDEQEMLREMVRGVCATHASLDVVREMEDDPVGLPDEFWKQLAELGLLGHDAPRGVRRLGMTMLDGVVVYEELGRALAPSPHFVSSVLSAGVLAARRVPTRSSDEWLPRIAAGEAIVTRRGSSPTAASARTACSSRATRRRRRLDARRHQAARAVRDGGRPAARARAHRRRPTVDLFLVDPNAAGRHAHAADDDRVRHAVPRRLRRRAGAGRRRASARAGDGLDDVGRDDARRHHPARRAGHRRRAATRSRSPCSTPRTASSSTSRSARSRRSRTTWPTRSPRSTAAETLVYEAAWARAERPRRSTGSRRWRSCSRARRSATSPRWRSRSSAASASRVEYDIQLYFRRAKQLQISWWNDRYLEELVAQQVLDDRQPAASRS